MLHNKYSLKFTKLNIRRGNTPSTSVVRFNKYLMNLIFIRPKVNGKRERSIRDHKDIGKNRLSFLHTFDFVRKSIL